MAETADSVGVTTGAVTAPVADTPERLLLASLTRLPGETVADAPTSPTLMASDRLPGEPVADAADIGCVTAFTTDPTEPVATTPVRLAGSPPQVLLPQEL